MNALPSTVHIIMCICVVYNYSLLTQYNIPRNIILHLLKGELTSQYNSINRVEIALIPSHHVSQQFTSGQFCRNILIWPNSLLAPLYVYCLCWWAVVICHRHCPHNLPCWPFPLIASVELLTGSSLAFSADLARDSFVMFEIKHNRDNELGRTQCYILIIRQY